MRDFSGKRYWLVGASEGLGAALARQLSAEGADLVLSARGREALDTLAVDLPGRAEVVPLDVRNTASITRAAAEIGEIDGMVYLAGAYEPMRVADWNADALETMIDVNLNGAARVLSACLPEMVARDRGHVVLIGSLASFRGLPSAIGYSASKAGLVALAESIQGDLRGSNVTLQISNPGFIRTRLTEKNRFRMTALMTPEVAARHVMDQMRLGGFRASFPGAFATLFRLTPFMPDWLYYRLFR